jgi:hypothetical protein
MMSRKWAMSSKTTSKDSFTLAAQEMRYYKEWRYALCWEEEEAESVSGVKAAEVQNWKERWSSHVIDNFGTSARESAVSLNESAAHSREVKFTIVSCVTL